MTHESNDLDATDVHLTVLHIPHALRTIPREVRADILLGDADLERELTWMTDAYTDEFHTPDSLVAAYEASFRREGFTVTRNRPFAGALVPSLHFRRDRRVTALMIEVNRKLYMDENSGARAEQFEAFGRRLRCIIEERIGAGTGGGVSR